MSMEDIDNLLRADQKDALDDLGMYAIETSVSDKETVQKLPPEYQDFRDVFDRIQVDKRPPQSRAYRMSPYKIQRVKEYLTENLSKGFITPSQVLYSSPVLFALKSNGDLRFCVDYRKLNTLTKRNRYLLPLIEEVIGKIMGCKHLTRLDIIAAFNKLRTDPDSEDLTTFVYKYKVLPFGLINGLSSF